MPRIKVLTDSTADLGQDLLEQYQISVVPLVVQFDQESYLDGVEMDDRRLFQMVEAKKRLPKTASPSPAAFHEAFRKATADGSQAIYVGLSSLLSATQQNARIAADMLPEGQAQTFDSLNLSTGIGLQVLYACELAQQGRTADQVIAALEEARPKVKTSFMVDTMEYLYMGGRCSGVQALMGSLLHIRPIIAVVDGAMTVAGKVRGSRQRGLDYMLEGFKQDAQAGRVRPDRVFVTHTTSHEDARYLMDRIKQIMPEVKAVTETEAGSVIGSHCGPGTIGVLYMLK